MSTLKTDVITNQAGSGPPTFPFGFNIGSGGSGSVNNIGLPGGQGFGLGICPGPLPVGMAKLSGCEDPASDNYGNYLFADGSVMCWIPAFYYKIGTGSNGLAINVVSVKAFGTYADVATANAAGYALHRNGLGNAQFVARCKAVCRHQLATRITGYIRKNALHIPDAMLVKKGLELCAI